MMLPSVLFTSRSRRQRVAAVIAAIAVAAIQPVAVRAHSGPPYPAADTVRSGAYTLSLWTDPDTTTDGTAGGQFWVVIGTADGSAVPAGTRTRIDVRPSDGTGVARTATGEPVRDDLGNQFAAVILDHEGPFAVVATVDGPLGHGVVNATVNATYDLRPPPAMLLLYLAPFLIAGFLWIKLLLRRRAGAAEQARTRR